MAHAPRTLGSTQPSPSCDQRVVLHGVSWSNFETLLAIRGDAPVPRMTYLEGELEPMAPSRDHEALKTQIANVLEAWAEERNVDLQGYGSWTLRNAPRARGVELDECYALGRGRDRPDFAIEIVWTYGGLDKLEVCRGLGIPEVWRWVDGVIEIHRLRGDRDERVEHSSVLPDLDQLLGFLDIEKQTKSVKADRAALRGR
jgi:Uma2 family endonuclease